MELFQAETLDQGVYRTSDAAGTKMYLVVGTISALLLDCGAGAGDVAAFVRGLTGKPLSVLITHGHVDHAMGRPAFSAKKSFPVPQLLSVTSAITEVPTFSTVRSSANNPNTSKALSHWRQRFLL